MKRENFGKIVKSLREQRLDFDSSHCWTQAKLACEANLSDETISKIERGRKANLAGETLLRLADALGLSTLERREFFAAATTITRKSVPVKSICAQETWDHVWKVFTKARLPGYLFDPFFDLIGINSATMALHGLNTQQIDAAIQSNLGCNVLGLLFQENAELRTAMADQWQRIVKDVLYQFRFIVLRYRHTKRFSQLLTELKELPDFVPLWMQTTRVREDFFSQLRRYKYVHTQHGPISYFTTLTSTVTPCGTIYMTTFEPCDVRTEKLFREFAGKHVRVRRVMPWPNPELR